MSPVTLAYFLFVIDHLCARIVSVTASFATAAVRVRLEKPDFAEKKKTGFAEKNLVYQSKTRFMKSQKQGFLSKTRFF